MTRQIPRDQSLTEEDRAYLHARGLHAEVERLDNEYPSAGSEADEESTTETMPDYTATGWTLAKLQAEVGRLNAEYNANLTDDGTKAEIIERLTEWWNRPE